jgi:type IV secretion system protein VirD4
MTQAKRSFPSRLFVLGVLVGVAGWTYKTLRPTDTGPGWALMVFGPVLSVAVVVHFVRSRRDTNATLNRWNRRSRRHGGTASWLDHLRVSSSWAMRRKAPVLKPSLYRRGFLRQWWVLLRTPVTEYATRLARAGRRSIWSPNEDVTGRFGGPRTGKTGELAGRIADAPGAVLATSTRVDLVELTAPLRRTRRLVQRGLPGGMLRRPVYREAGEVHIFNPGGLGGWTSTLKWSPLTGCRNPETAQLRAADMIPSSGSSEGERWDEQARAVLAVFLHAASLHDLPMRAVLAWVTDPSEVKAREVDKALQDSPEARTMRLAAQQFFNTNSRTQSSITTSVMPALRWLNNPRAAAIGDATADELVDVEALIRGNATVYLLDGETGSSAPLIAALVSEFARKAREIAATMPGGRLDPSLTLALDEVALVCPIPLHRWSSDMGGRGITIHYSLQSQAQLRDKWGDDAAGTILNNTGTVLVYGGTKDPEDLRAWSMLSGEREVSVETEDADGKVVSRTTRKEPILSEGSISNLPAGTCMISRRGMPISIGQTEMAWKRADINKARKANPFNVITETNYREKGLGDDLRVGGAIPVKPVANKAPEAPAPAKPTPEPTPAPKPDPAPVPSAPAPSWSTPETPAEPAPTTPPKTSLSWPKPAAAPEPEAAQPAPVQEDKATPEPAPQYQPPQREMWFTKRTED